MVAFEATGTKVDSLGATEFPGGTETGGVLFSDARNLLNEEGYWTTSSGDSYMLVDIYFTDRLTGQLYSETQSMFIDPGVNLATSPFNGTQDITQTNGVSFAGETALDVATEVLGPTRTSSPEETTQHEMMQNEDDIMQVLMSDEHMMHDNTLHDEDNPAEDHEMMIM